MEWTSNLESDDRVELKAPTAWKLRSEIRCQWIECPTFYSELWVNELSQSLPYLRDRLKQFPLSY